MHEGQKECMYEALTNLIIISVRPLGSSLAENFGSQRGGYSKQRLFQENDMTSWRAPDCDTGAREPKTVQELCTSYLPRNWALVVQGLTVAASAFDYSEGCQIHRIVVLENDPDREAFIRRRLTAIHDGGSEGVQGRARVVEEGTGVDVEEVHTRRAQSRGNFNDDEAEEDEEESDSGEHDLERGGEEDIAYPGDSSENGSSGDSRDDSIAEGAIILGGGNRVVASLEGNVADPGTSPSRGR